MLDTASGKCYNKKVNIAATPRQIFSTRERDLSAGDRQAPLSAGEKGDAMGNCQPTCCRGRSRQCWLFFFAPLRA